MIFDRFWSKYTAYVENLPLVGNSNTSIFRDAEGWVPCDLPQKPVRIGKIPRISTPEGFLSGLEQLCACRLCLCENQVNFFPRTAVVCERYSAETIPIGGNIRILCKFAPWVQGESHPPGLEEHNALSFRHRTPPSETPVEFST